MEQRFINFGQSTTRKIVSLALCLSFVSAQEPKKPSPPVDETARLIQSARESLRGKNYREALLKAEEVLRGARDARQPWGVIDAWWISAECYDKLDDGGKALEYLGRAQSYLRLLLASPTGILNKERLLDAAVKVEELAGDIHNERRSYESALSFFLRAAAHEKTRGGSPHLAQLLYKTAVNYYYLGNFEKSLEQAFLGLDEAQKTGSHNHIAGAAYMAGYLYRDLKNNDLALEYFRMALTHADQGSDPKWRVMALNEIGNVLTSQKKYDEALTHKEMALREARASGDIYNISNCLNDLGTLSYSQGDYEKALRSFQEAYELDSKSGLLRETAITAANIASIHIIRNEARRAVDILSRILPAVEKAGLRNEMLTIYTGLLEAHLRLGDRQESLRFLDKANAARESVFNEELARKVADLQEKYKAEKQQRENDRLKNDIRIQDLEMSEQRNVRNFLIFLSILVVLMAAVLFNRYRFKTRANSLLRKANKQIRENQEELARANKRLDELSRIDPLTGLANRREMLERLGLEKARCEQRAGAFSLIMADIDCFKFYNDTLGHDCGDFVLKTLAPLLRKSVRRRDLVCRWGGDEFLFLLPETDVRGGRVVMRKIDSLVRRSVFRCKDKKLRMRISLGLSVFRPGKDIDDCLKEADLAMFDRKRRSRPSLSGLIAPVRRRTA